MNKHTLRVLEFNNILSLLKGFAASNLGEALCESLKPKRDVKEIEVLLNEVSELKEVLQTYADIPISGIRNIEKPVTKTRVEGAIMDPIELLDILSTLKATHKLKRLFGKLEDNRYPLLKAIGNSFISLPNIEHKIEQTVGERGDILDSASPELKAIREKVRRLRKKIHAYLEDLLSKDSLQSFFQERIITVRNGRYVIPVKSDFKGHVQGIIHDHSHSKATYFIEPISTIELNNELGILFKEEKNEELRVLGNLSNNIKANAQEILSNLSLLGKVDLTYAKAKYSIELNAIKPVLNREGIVNLINAYHPLLLSLQNVCLPSQRDRQRYSDREEPANLSKGVIPIDIHFDKDCNTLIITGANTGGKTVALKTVGILTLMLQAGMHIPVADGSVAAIFDSIFADIGDEQDIEQNLSTFSSHISQMVNILDKANESSLVLLDEMGVGTDPDEGAALATALLDYLRGKNCSIIATTHLNLLKAYAYLHKDAMNVSVEFDSKTMEPRYRLLYGFPGESNALVIAEKLGIPREILNKAVSFMEGKNGDISRLIRTLESSQREITEDIKEVKRIKEIILLYQKQVESLLEKIQEKKDRILLETETKARSFLRKAENEVTEISRNLKKKGECSIGEVDKRLHNLKEELELFRPVKKRDRSPLLNPRKGDIVKISPLNKEGVIVRVQGDSDKVDVLIGNLRVKVPLNELEQVNGNRLKRTESKEDVLFTPLTTGMTGKINLVGMRVDDAIPLVDKVIDNAILSGMTRVDIVHGVGTGRLRDAIRDHLNAHSFVVNFNSADLSQGGTGVTVVEIKV
ncbi:MAG: endonuclease MutS2 [Desulfobacterales bacterium]|nr:endonuclease MutS2 [Desulfobacterales bacterium]